MSVRKREFEIGIYTFVENTPDPETGLVCSSEKRIADLLDSVELADKVGLDIFAIGEHHRPEYLSSAPEVLLAAAAARTSEIRLSSAVSVLSSDDPVRVFQRFATVDLISGGRAEIMAGRGSFIESFPLFGYDLREYEALFDEKLEMLIKIGEDELLNWSGRVRPAVNNLGIYPRPAQDRIPLWVAVGGTPKSVVRAANLGLPMALAIIGGVPERFAGMTRLYAQAWAEAGHNPEDMLFSINSHGFIADSREEAIQLAFPAFTGVMDRIGRERGWPGTTRTEFEASASLTGANFLGSPDDIIEKILYQHRIFGHHRFMIQLTVGTIAHEKVRRAIELLGTVVAPAVRTAIASGNTA